jgi:homocysteine S-methyltransferase
MNLAAVRIAREAADGRAFGCRSDRPARPADSNRSVPTSFDEAKDMFKEQVEALLEGGVDLFVLETFPNCPLSNKRSAAGPRAGPICL